MWIEALATAGDLGRLHEIARVLARHGFGDLAQRSGLVALLRRAGRRLSLEVDERWREIPTPERLRRALEELGPTFVKLGQILAGRRDLLSPAWIHELSRLHATVEPVPWEAVREQLAEDLGAAPGEVFPDLDPRPLAAGSIAQVHAASLADGTRVVLKVRRPRIEARVAADLRWLARFAAWLEREEPELARFRPRAIQRQFARTLREELDLRIESAHLAAIGANLPPDGFLVVPRVFERWTSERLLVMTRLEGIQAVEWIEGRRPGPGEAPIDAAALAASGARAVVDMVLRDGLFHADPHPGNLFLLGEGRAGLIDFGMVGRLSAARRRELLALFDGVLRRDVDRVVDVLLRWNAAGDAEPEELAEDCASFIDRYRGVALGDLDVTRMLLDVTAIVRENDLALPADVALLIKVFVTLEGLGRALDPEFELTRHLEPVVSELARREASPRAVLRRDLGELRALLRRLPEDARALLGRLRRRGIRVHLDLDQLEASTARLERSANRITIGLVTAASIVGTAIVLTVDRGPRLLGLPVIALLGFATSLLLALGLLLAIRRAH